MPLCSSLSYLYRDAHFWNASIFCSVYFMKNKNVIEMGEMGQAGEKWDKMGERWDT